MEEQELITGMMGIAMVAVLATLFQEPSEPTPPLEAADIRVEDLIVDLVEVFVGAQNTIRVTAKNYDVKAGSKTITCSVNGTSAAQTVTLDPGASQQVSFVTTPDKAGTYQVEIDGLTGSFLAVEVPELVTFTVRVSDIPSYASAAYQWYISYHGEHGMVDPQGGIWTPIADPITVSDVPPTGTLQVTLMAGAYQSWDFRAFRIFVNGKEYTFNLTAGYLASGIAVTNLVIGPAVVTVGEPVTISVDVINTEDTSEQYEVTFTINGTVKKVAGSLGPKEIKSVSTTVTPVDPGSYGVGADGLFGNFIALAKPEPPPPGGVGSIRNASWTWGREPLYNSIDPWNHLNNFIGEIYHPEVKNSEGGLYFTVIFQVTGVKDTYMKCPRCGSVYSYSASWCEACWIAAGRPSGDLSTMFPLVRVPIYATISDGGAYGGIPVKGPFNAGWFGTQAQRYLPREAPYYYPLGLPLTVEVYIRIETLTWGAGDGGIPIITGSLGEWKAMEIKLASYY